MDEADQAVQISLLSLNTLSHSFSPLQTCMQRAFQERLMLHYHRCPFRLEPAAGGTPGTCPA